MLPADPYLDIHSPDDIRVHGTRVGIEQIIDGFLDGSIPEAIAVEFPTVTLEQIYGVIAYYLRNRTEADAYMARLSQWSQEMRKQQLEQLARGEAPDVVRRLRMIADKRNAG